MRKIDILNFITDFRKVPNQVKTLAEIKAYVGSFDELQLISMLEEMKQMRTLRELEKNGDRAFQVMAKWSSLVSMPSIVIEGKLDSVAGYSSISKDYAYTFDAMKSLTFDIWLASHASQFKLHSKRKPGDEYNPAAFVDRAGYDALLSDLQLEYNQRK